MRLLIAALVALPLLPQVAAAQARTPALDCQNGPQSALNECAGAAFRAADAQLNAVYRKLTARLAGGPGARSLVEAQRAWVRFRDAECELATSDNEGGSIRPMLTSACMESMTRRRTAALEEYMGCKRDGSCLAPPR